MLTHKSSLSDEDDWGFWARLGWVLLALFVSAAFVLSAVDSWGWWKNWQLTLAFAAVCSLVVPGLITWLFVRRDQIVKLHRELEEMRQANQTQATTPSPNHATTSD